MKYRALWFTEIVLIVLLLGVVYVPVQDYAMTEYKEYLRHPSPITLKAFQDKTEEEFRLRKIAAIPIAIGLFTIAVAISRVRRRSPKAP